MHELSICQIFSNKKKANVLRNIFFLAFKYLIHHRLLSFILITCMAITWFIPLFTIRISQYANQTLMARANATPLIIGRKGGKLSLVLNTLYFRSSPPELLQYKMVKNLQTNIQGSVIPIHNLYRSKSHPVIGTSPDYFIQRNLQVRSGTLPLKIGDVVLGDLVAGQLNLKPGDHLLSDTGNLYNISAMYPLQMNVVGILDHQNTPDDHAVFVDIKTTWIMDGLLHGHEDAQKLDMTQVAEDTGNKRVLNAKVHEYTKITKENIQSFHFHGSNDKYPLTAILVYPKNDKESTLIKSEINLSELHQAISPPQIIRQLMELVFNIQKMLSFYFILISLTTILFLCLFIILTLKLRLRERHLFQMIGGSPNTIFMLMFIELLLLFSSSLIISVITSECMTHLIQHLQLI